MTKKSTWVALSVVTLALAVVGYGLWADEFTDEDVARWQVEYMSVVNEGRTLWGSADLGTTALPAGSATPTPPTRIPRPTRSSSSSSARWSSCAT